MLCKLINWFLYDSDFRHERVKIHQYSLPRAWAHAQLQTAIASCKYIFRYRFINFFCFIFSAHSNSTKLTIFKIFEISVTVSYYITSSDPDKVKTMLYRCSVTLKPENEKLRTYQRWFNSWKFGTLSHSLCEIFLLKTRFSDDINDVTVLGLCRGWESFSSWPRAIGSSSAQIEKGVPDLQSL